MDKNLPEWETIDDIVQEWKKEHVALDLLKKCGVSDIGLFESIEQYEKDDYRKALIFNIRNKWSNQRQKILLDIKMGWPSTDQVYDAIYEYGKDCHKRIIVFAESDHNEDSDIPNVDESLVANLISVMNEYKLNLKMLCLNRGSFTLTLPTMGLDVDIRSKELPTKKQFRFEEFWVVFLDSLCEGWYNPYQAFSGNFRKLSDWGYTLYVHFFADLPVYWNDSGIFFVVKQTDDRVAYLKELWIRKEKELQNRYGAQNIDFEYLPGKMPKITIRYSYTPLNWLFTATSREKMELAKTLYEDLWRFRWFMEDEEDAMDKSVFPSKNIGDNYNGKTSIK